MHNPNFINYKAIVLMIKKLFFLFTLCLTALGGVAQTTVTFTAGTDKGLYDGSKTSPKNGAETVTKDGVSIHTNYGAFGAAQYRTYKGAYLTVSSSVGQITKVVITCTASGTSKYGPGCFTLPPVKAVGTYAYDGKIGTWTGVAESFELLASTNQVRATKIEVTYSTSNKKQAGLAFDTTTCTAVLGQAVTTPTLQNPNNLPVTYTSSNPAVATVDANGTVTPVATGKTEIVVRSEETDDFFAGSASYTLNVTATDVNLDYKEPFTTGQGSFTVDDKTLPEGLKSVWKTDSKYGMSGSAYISSKQSKNAAESWLISPNITLKYADGTTLTKAMLTFSHNIGYFASADSVALQTKVKLKVADGQWTDLDVTYPKWVANGYSKFTADTIDLSQYIGKTIKVAFVYTSDTTSTGTWEIKDFAVLGMPNVTTVAQASALDNGAEFTFTGKAAVAYQHGDYLYVHDATGTGLIYGTQTETFHQGQVLNAGWTGTKTTYSGLREFKNVAGLSASGETQTVDFDQVIVGTPTQVTTSMQNQYIQLCKVNVKAGKGAGAPAHEAPARAANQGVTNFVIGSDSTFTAGTTIDGYNTFDIDMSALTEHDGETFTVEGFVAIYINAVSFYPISIKHEDVTGVASVNAAKAVKSVNYYNLAGQASAQPFEGVNIVHTTYTDGTTSVAKVMR